MAVFLILHYITFQVFPFVSVLNAQIRTSFMFLQVALVNIAAVKITFRRIKVFIFLYLAGMYNRCIWDF